MEYLVRILLCLSFVVPHTVAAKQTDQDPADEDSGDFNPLCLGDFSFQCLNSTMCIFRDYLCDGITDCDNGSDEWDEECVDRHDQENWDIKIGYKLDEIVDAESDSLFGSEASIPCEKGSYPAVCDCKHTVVFRVTDNYTEDGVMPNNSRFNIVATHVDCFQRNLTRVPENITRNVTILDLENNAITEIREDDFAGMFNLKELYLSKNDIVKIGNDTLKDLKSLELLQLRANRLSNLPDGIFASLENLQVIDLDNNAIRKIKKGLLEKQTSLKYLSLSWNNPLEVEFGAFEYLNNLETLNLLDVGLSHITSGIFRNLKNLADLNLERNLLLSIKKDDLTGLSSLQHLKLKSNSITRIEAGAFEETKKLSSLILSFNHLEIVKYGLFQPLQDLQILDLSRNEIRLIEDEALSHSGKLSHALLSDNKLQDIHIGMLDNLTKLTNLDLLNNQIESVELGSLDDLEDLVTLDLRENKLSVLPRGIFKKLASLKWLYFDHFSLCGYAPTVRHCYPRGDGISTIENLLDSMLLRVVVWIVATLACVGNILVPFARCLLKDDNRVHSFFIMNLSFADLLMGLYLFIIAANDVAYRGDYIRFDLSWRMSWLCQMCGFMSLLSCESSVLILTVITFDRFISVVYPFRFKDRSMKVASGTMLAVWVTCFFIAGLPLVQSIGYFDYLFYGGNGVCLPLHINQAETKGWQYSFTIFVAVNFLAFLCIVYGYVQMFYNIRKSRKNTRSTSENQDMKLAKRFTLIVSTDLLCWMPIIVIKFLALGGARIEPSVYAWVAVFVLPVNSALNPFLYTMTTKAFKQRLRRLIGTFSKEKKTDDYFSVRSSRALMSAGSAGSRLSENGKICRNIRCSRQKSKPGSKLSTNRAKSEMSGKRLTHAHFGNPSAMSLSHMEHHRIVCIVPNENSFGEKNV